MYAWLTQDLAKATSTPGIDWLVAAFHSPPYSFGRHDSDREGDSQAMRRGWLPILEAAGVDLVLTGHSHNYERSKLIDGHYGKSSTFHGPCHVIDGNKGDPSGTGSYFKPAGFKPHAGAVVVRPCGVEEVTQGVGHRAVCLLARATAATTALTQRLGRCVDHQGPCTSSRAVAA